MFLSLAQLNFSSNPRALKKDKFQDPKYECHRVGWGISRYIKAWRGKGGTFSSGPSVAMPHPARRHRQTVWKSRLRKGEGGHGSGPRSVNGHATPQLRVGSKVGNLEPRVTNSPQKLSVERSQV